MHLFVKAGKNRFYHFLDMIHLKTMDIDQD